MTFWQYLHAAFFPPSYQLLLRQHAAKYRDQMHPSYRFGQGFDFSKDPHDVAFARREEAYRPTPVAAVSYPVIDQVIEQHYIFK